MRYRFNALMTILGISKKGIYIPYRYSEKIRSIEYVEIESIFEKFVPLFLKHLELIDSLYENLSNIEKNIGLSARWNQDWFPRSDAASTYAMVVRASPKKIIEIGSGHSTRFMIKAIIDHNLQSKIECIDPEPRASFGSFPFVRHINSALDAENIENLSLQSGDILFVDSSHILMPGSDVDIIINKILPKLPKGVFVHFHDIFLPDGYPKIWEWRSYNEQLAIAQTIQNDSWSIEWSSHYFVSRMKSYIKKSVLDKIVLVPDALESSLWLRKK